MEINLKTRVKPDGMLDLHIPTELGGAEVDVLISIKPLDASSVSADSTVESWPPEFFERTFGSLADDPLEREPQGEYEVRESLE